MPDGLIGRWAVIPLTKWEDRKPMEKVAAKRGRKTNTALREASTGQISSAALKLFVRRGYQATTVDQIAKDAKMTKGGVYFYINKKENLLLSLLDGIEERYMKAPFAEIAASAVPFKEKIVRLMHFQVTYAVNRPEDIMLLVMMSVEFSGKKIKPARRIEEIYNRMHGFMKELVISGVEAGEFHTSLPTEELASFFLSAHDGMMLEWYRRQRRISGENLVRVFRRIFLDALEQEGR